MSPTSVPVPATLDQLLTPEWLSSALGRRFPGVEVTAVASGPVVSRLSTNARFTIECNDEVPEGLVHHLCAKGYFAESQRSLAWLGEPEARFHATLSGPSGVRTLACVYADVDPETHHGVIITHDVIAAGGMFLDALTPYSVDQTAASLEQYAKLHAATWGASDPELAWVSSRFAGAAGSSGSSVFTSMRGVDDVRRNFEGPIGVEVAEEIRRDPQRVIDAMHALGTRERSGGVCVVHGDAHVGNLMLNAEGQPGLVDWQVISRNHWSVDVGYHIASALDTVDRKRSERDLLAHYLDHLRASGVDAPHWDDAWDDYRTSIAYGVFMWGVTRLVDPAIIQRLLQRLTAAAADHDSFGRLGV